jgi:GNAT superfamily N-acetyltransferase
MALDRPFQGACAHGGERGLRGRLEAVGRVRSCWWGVVRQSSGMTDQIAVASSDEDYSAFGELVREYWDWLLERYAYLPGFVDSVGGHQAIDAELVALREKYGPPAGTVLLARRGHELSGGIAYRDLGDGSCEMKRLFVVDRFQGHGLGRRLCEALIDAATAEGYSVMRLDTGEQNSEALAMYTSLGFRECAPFHDYPAELMPHLRFMELPLTPAPTA